MVVTENGVNFLTCGSV